MKPRQASFEAIGTRWQINAGQELAEAEWERLNLAIRARINEFDLAYSRFRQDSLVWRISQEPGRYRLPPDGPKLLEFYERLYRATDGLVTPLIGQVVSDAGYDAGYSFITKPLAKPPAWDGVLELRGHELEVKTPVLLDFGAAGKGYLVDLVGELLEKHGVNNFMINAGGDILHRGPQGENIRLGLENPQDSSQALGVADLSNQSLCASSGSRRQWGKFHHLINPHTLESPGDVLAAWVVADDAMTADGLATALFFTGAKRLSKAFAFEYAVLHKDMSLTYSARFPAELFTK